MDVNKELDSLRATMNLENLELDNQDMKYCKKILKGELTADQACKNLLKKYIQ